MYVAQWMSGLGDDRARPEPTLSRQTAVLWNRELKLGAFEIKGWCPGALRPMPSGDGLVVRVRPMLGRLSLSQLIALAEAAERFGNGQIDLTRRANLQIRGVDESKLASLQGAIRSLGLLDADARAESARNIMVSPLSGIEPAAHDVGSVAADLGQSLADDPALWGLPVKFGFIVDGGGLLDLMMERADIRVVAINDRDFAIGLDRKAGIEWLGSVAREAAAETAITIAASFVHVNATATGRMRDLCDEGIAKICSRMKSRISPLLLAVAHKEPANPAGLFDFGAGHFAVGIAIPFGRVESDQILALAEEMVDASVAEVRLSPWRMLYAQIGDVPAGHRILDAAAARGWIVTPDDPLLQIEACPGAPLCTSTSLDTRAAARQIAAQWPTGYKGTAHVSGCAKGCARSQPSNLVLVGNGDHYGIVRNGTARDKVSGEVSLGDLPAHLHQIYGFRHTYD
jgi:precorrin-3B synthase